MQKQIGEIFRFEFVAFFAVRCRERKPRELHGPFIHREVIAAAKIRNFFVAIYGDIRADDRRGNDERSVAPARHVARGICGNAGTFVDRLVARRAMRKFHAAFRTADALVAVGINEGKHNSAAVIDLFIATGTICGIHLGAHG